MLANARDTLFSEQPHQAEESRLILQLTNIDQHLRSRRQSLTNHEKIQTLPRQQGNSFEQHDKYYFSKEKQTQEFYNPNMEYFSEICNEEFEDDSLFDPQNNFLAPQKVSPQLHEALFSQEACSRPKKKKLGQPEAHQYPLKNSKSQAAFPSQSQILKERKYIYKKQNKNPSFGVGGFPPHPKASKSITRKSSGVPQKGENKMFSIGQNKNKPTQGSFLKKSLSKDKYISKPAIKQEKESMQSEELEEDEDFKFQTFQAYLEAAGDTCESYEKNKRRRCKHEDVNEDSLECTFKPKILKKSEELARSTKNVVERLSASGIGAKDQKKPYQKQPTKASLNRNRLQELSQPRRLKTQGPQLAEETPSFRPSLSKKSLQQMSHCTYDVATRNQLWLEQKAEKMERLRQEQEKERQRKEDCTYSPSLCPYRGEINPQLSRFGRQGMANYFQRLSTQKNQKLSGKENKYNKSNINSSKDSFVSKGGKKQNYNEAVKQLHSRIMGLKI